MNTQAQITPRNYMMFPALPIRTRTETRIIKQVCEEFKITQEELKSVSRRKNIVQARQVAMVLLVNKTRLSKIQIGQLFDKDHSTVIHCEKVMDNEQFSNSELFQRYTKLYAET